MKNIEVVMVRVYLPGEGPGRDTLLKRLRDWQHVGGATVFEGVPGREPPGVPSVIEFHEIPDKAMETIEFLHSLGVRVVHWRAQLCGPEER